MLRLQRTLHRFGTFSVLLLIAACGGGGDGGGTTAPPPSTPAPVASVSVTLAASSIFVGATTQATATARDAQGRTLDGRTITWSSSNTTVATVAAIGLVTGVAPGNANIVATSEGQSGQAAITVALDPSTQVQIGPLTLTSNGAPVNLNDIAGTITISFDATIPAGFRGVQTVTLGGVELARDSVRAVSPDVAGDAAPRSMTLIPSSATVNTAQPQFTLTADALENTPIRNGSQLLVTALNGVVGTTPLSAQRQTSVNLNNVDVLTGAARLTGRNLMINGRQVYEGDVEIAPTFVSYSGQAIQEIQIVTAPSMALYAASSIPGAINLTTRRGPDAMKRFTVSKSQFAIESASAGTDFIVTQYTVGGNVVRPGLGGPIIQNRCFFTRGTGWAQATTPANATLPNGCSQFVTPPGIPTSVLGPFWNIANTVHVDNRGPVAQPGAYTLPDRPTTVGARATNAFGTFCCSNGHVGRDHDFSHGIDLSKFADASGIDAAKTEYYVAPLAQRALRFSAQYRWQNNNALAETNAARDFVAGARFFDPLGNFTDVPLTTSPGNNWTLNGQPGSSVGVDEGIFSFSRTDPTVTSTGLPTHFVWNQSTIPGSLGWNINLQQSRVGFPNNWISWRAKYNDQPLIGAGTGQADFAIRSASGGSTSASGFIPYSDLTSANQQRQGMYYAEIAGADHAGLPGGMGYAWAYAGLWDFTRPTASLTPSAPLTAGQTAAFTIGATDAAGGDLERYYYGVQFELSHPSFTGGFVQTYLGYNDIGDGLGGSQVTTYSLQGSAGVPEQLRFFDPFGGSIEPNGYRTRNAIGLAEDVARNLSNPFYAPIVNTGALSSPVNVSRLTMAVNTTSNPNLVDLIFEALSPLGGGGGPLPASPISKAAFLALPSDGLPRLLERDVTPIATTVSGGTQYRFQISYDVRDWCGPAGTVQLFASALSADSKIVYKPNSFFARNWTQGANCTSPRRLSPAYTDGAGPKVRVADLQAR